MLIVARHICDTCGRRFAWDEKCRSHAYGPIEGACVVFCSDGCAGLANATGGGIEAFFHERIEKVRREGMIVWQRRKDEHGLEVRPLIAPIDPVGMEGDHQ